MKFDPVRFKKTKVKAHALYAAKRAVRCPYFGTDVALTSDGFHHLRFSARRERSKRAQLLKFSLLPLALDIIKKSGTIQEYRNILAPVGKPSVHDGFTPMKETEYWGLVAITGNRQRVKVRVILRRIGDGKIAFWSVMPDKKFINGAQRLADEGIEDA
ncbi:hypothetical protein HY478_00210 [Candidatus Uhrbacteria bacterium]|nr:hypothetical protein [Candidatus Uhrbacteria bacterium]